MSESDVGTKLEELDRLLNDPDVPMEPAKVWSLLAELSHPEPSPVDVWAQPVGSVAVGNSAG